MIRRTNLPGDGFMVGEWTVLPSLDRIVCGERSVHIQPRLMDALVYLAGRPGEVISKEEIIDAVWAQEFVANAVLTRAVSELRRALGDVGSKRRYIETIPKRGYRLIAEVTLKDGTPDSGTSDGFLEFPRPTGRQDGSSGAFVLGPDTRCCLIYNDSELALEDGEYVIGRGLEASVAIRQPGVSRLHARIRIRDGVVTIEDLGSRNGTFVSGRQIEGPVRLRDGDRIAVGVAVLFYRDLTNATTRGHFTDRSDP